MSAVDVHAVVEGPPDAPVVVLSPSLGSTNAMWDPQARELSRSYRVVRYDPRGHGRSPVPPGPYDLPDLAEDVVALLDRLDVGSAHYVGLSLGGMTGMALAAAHPERVRSLVLCSTSALLGPATMWAERAAAVRAEGTASIAETVVSRWLTPGYAAEHPDLVARLRAMVADVPDEGYAACCGAIERMDLRADLQRITAPTLVVAGAQDPATPPEHAARIAEGISGARVELLDPAAHLANLEQPDAVTALIQQHVAATEGAAA
jgi:3-oxoadipate enol-lactonase